MSSVFYKFRSQKEPQRVTFDGTSISCYELKKEIITISRLGDGTDFDLLIFNEDTNEEYDDDTTLIPRSTSVIARRLPASKPGQGRAARYVSGKAPINAKNAYRTEQSNAPLTSKATPALSNGVAAMNKAQTEEEKIAAMFQAGADQWEQQKQSMANATPIYRPGGMKGGKPMTVPDHEPPPGYICYRCGEKGHWIQACPTNNDPTFDNRLRVKRTTGIPRSMLQTVEKPVSLVNDGLTDDARQPSGVMVNADGEFVVAVPDQASWEQYQAKAQASAAKEDVASTGSKELQDRGLECPIDKRMFVDPVKTPCCAAVYCHECIENALVNSDLVCPGCGTEGVLIDNLTADDGTNNKIAEYEAEKKKAEEDAKKPAKPEPAPSAASPVAAPASTSTSQPTTKSPTPPTASPQPPTGPRADLSSQSRKRGATEELTNDRKASGPPASAPTGPRAAQPPSAPAGLDRAFAEQMNALLSPPPGPGAAPGMMMPGMMGFSGMDMSAMGMMPGMGMGMMHGMMPGMMPGMGGMPGMMGGMNPMMMSGFPGMGMNMGMNGMNGMGMGMGMNGWNGNGMNMGMGMQSQQQQYNGNAGDDANAGAYMRQPVNPGRHRGGLKKARPTDYREL